MLLDLEKIPSEMAQTPTESFPCLKSTLFGPKPTKTSPLSIFMNSKHTTFCWIRPENLPRQVYRASWARVGIRPQRREHCNVTCHLADNAKHMKHAK